MENTELGIRRLDSLHPALSNFALFVISRIFLRDCPAAYNADGQRIQKQSPTGSTHFVYDFSVLLREYDAVDAVQADYTAGLQEEYGEMVSEYRDAQSGYYLFDGSDSTAALLDPSAAVADRYTYRAFGEVETHSGSSPNPFTYVGRWGYNETSELGLYLAAAGAETGRYYDPESGQFISVDSVEDDLNTYRYVRNNPVNLSDPSGAIIPLVVLGIAALKLAALGALEGAIIGGLYALISCTNFWEQVLIGGLGGAILGPIGGAIGWAIGRAGGFIGNRLGGFIRRWGDEGLGGLKRGWNRLKGWSRKGGRKGKGAGTDPYAPEREAWEESWEAGGRTADNWGPGAPGTGPKPSVGFPGNTPMGQPPAPGFVWRGKPPVGGRQGNWHNPTTGESLSNDMSNTIHGPHWDYRIQGQKGKWRWYPDGRKEFSK